MYGRYSGLRTQYVQHTMLFPSHLALETTFNIQCLTVPGGWAGARADGQASERAGAGQSM